MRTVFLLLGRIPILLRLKTRRLSGANTRLGRPLEAWIWIWGGPCLRRSGCFVGCAIGVSVPTWLQLLFNRLKNKNPTTLLSVSCHHTPLAGELAGLEVGGFRLSRARRRLAALSPFLKDGAKKWKFKSTSGPVFSSLLYLIEQSRHSWKRTVSLRSSCGSFGH